LGKVREAEESFRSGLAEATRWGDPERIWQAHRSLGRVAEEQGNDQEAANEYVNLGDIRDILTISAEG
jgi:hypothetical protein